MNRLPGPVSKSLELFKTAPIPEMLTKKSMPILVRNMILGQVAFYGTYQLVSGPNKMKLKRYFTVSPESSLLSLATFNLCHTNAVPLLFNMAILGTVGASLCRTRGSTTFLTVWGLGAAASAVLTAIDARSNQKQTQAGAMGPSTALLSYTCFSNPAFFTLSRFNPLFMVAVALGYGITYDDKAAIGGIPAGYLAFLLAL